jgi:hypothetical protein
MAPNTAWILLDFVLGVAPQFGHVVASLLTSFPHSWHFIKAMYSSVLNTAIPGHHCDSVRVQRIQIVVAQGVNIFVPAAPFF